MSAPNVQTDSTSPVTASESHVTQNNKKEGINHQGQINHNLLRQYVLTAVGQVICLTPAVSHQFAMVVEGKVTT